MSLWPAYLSDAKGERGKRILHRRTDIVFTVDRVLGAHLREVENANFELGEFA